MKKIGFIMTICGLLLLTAGCKKGAEPDSIIGNQSKPEWTATADYDITASMTAIVRIDLSKSFSEERLAAAGYSLSNDDLTGAFSGDECLGTAQLKDGVFYLFISAPKSGGGVSLKYYSATLKNTFMAESLPFKNDEQLGTVSTPYTPVWVVAN